MIFYIQSPERKSPSSSNFLSIYYVLKQIKHFDFVKAVIGWRMERASLSRKILHI